VGSSPIVSTRLTRDFVLWLAPVGTGLCSFCGSCDRSVGSASRTRVRGPQDWAVRPATRWLAVSILADAGLHYGLVKGRTTTRGRPRLRRPLTSPPDRCREAEKALSWAGFSSFSLFRRPTDTAGESDLCGSRNPCSFPDVSVTVRWSAATFVLSVDLLVACCMPADQGDLGQQ